MSSYIKKSLLIYISLVIICLGMAASAYAITADEAFKYLTRSQYATDIAYLQLKLDEAESGIVGKINKYRSTDVKFVTYDTPTKYNTAKGSPYAGGYYNGGNYFPRKRYESGGWLWAWGPDGLAATKTGSNKDIRICRIWNGNYYITNGTAYSNEAATNASYNYPGCNFAVPVENLPGWYLVLFHYYTDSRAMYYTSLIKLDPNVPYGSRAEQLAISSKELQIRFKKDLFILTSDVTTPLSTTPTKTSVSTNYYNNNAYFHGLNRSFTSGHTTTSKVINYTGYVEEKTGDYIIKITGMSPCCPEYGYQQYLMTEQNQMLSRYIPADNVEYVQYATIYMEYRTDTSSCWPDSRHIGDGLLVDPYFTYEFVDCANGIKYWHAYRKATKDKIGTTRQYPFGIHYSLPIVY